MEKRVTFPVPDQTLLSFYHVREQGRPHHCKSSSCFPKGYTLTLKTVSRIHFCGVSCQVGNLEIPLFLKNHKSLKVWILLQTEN